MATTTFSGPVVSQNGFIGAFEGPVTGPVVATTITASGNSALYGAANVLVIPTSDPGVAGALWNNAGTLTISAG